MGWGDCGTDSTGRPIGYSFEATCDFPGCNEKIDRGLSYACGDMHGEGNFHDDSCGCEKYFCEKHKSNYVELESGDCVQICDECASRLILDDDNKIIGYKE